MKSLKKMARKRKIKNQLGISDNYKTWIVSGSTLLSALLVKKALEFIWKTATKRDPPKNPADPNISWGEAIAWTMLSGFFVSMARLIIRRNLSIGVDEAS